MTTAADLDARYGRRAGRRRLWWVIGSAAVALVVGWYAWSLFADPGQSVNVDATAYQIEDHSVTVEFQVTAPAGTAVACAVSALDEEFGVVGWKVVEIPPSDQHMRAFRETVPVVAPATTGLVKSCWVP